MKTVTISLTNNTYPHMCMIRVNMLYIAHAVLIMIICIATNTLLLRLKLIAVINH